MEIILAMLTQILNIVGLILNSNLKGIGFAVVPLALNVDLFRFVVRNFLRTFFTLAIRIFALRLNRRLIRNLRSLIFIFLTNFKSYVLITNF